MKSITKFIFKQAQYELTNSEGKIVKLKMNYAGNSYEIVGEADLLVKRIAEDLLKKKHAINFADKFSEYTLE